MHTLRQYLFTLSDLRGLARTLGEAEVCRDAAGRPEYAVGNSAAVFRIRHAGRIRSLRCFLRPMRHLREIYGERLLERELFLYDSVGPAASGEWVDVVLDEWIEGETLREAVRRAAGAGDRMRLAGLSAAFDTLAAAMVSDRTAHGDLKPENLIVDPAGALHPIDFDAAFLPAFAGEQSPELGTAAYQHPARTAADFDASLDDYPAALISTALHALRVDPALHDRYGPADGLLFTPRRIPDEAPYREALALFERHGMAAEYRIARLLASPSLRLFGLGELLAAVRHEPPETAETDGADRESPAPETRPAPELFAANGLWGYRTAERVVVAPLYDNGFDFTEGLAAVQLGGTWHYIDTAGRTRLSCPGCAAVKPFRGGKAQVVRNGRVHNGVITPVYARNSVLFHDSHSLIDHGRGHQAPAKRVVLVVLVLGRAAGGHLRAAGRGAQSLVGAEVDVVAVEDVGAEQERVADQLLLRLRRRRAHDQ